MTLNTGLFNRDDLTAVPIAAEPLPKLDVAAAGAQAMRIEGIDAAGTRATLYRMGVGDTFNGTLSAGGDQDWVRVTNGNGALIRTDDDGGTGTNSRMVLQGNSPGTYYLGAASYGGAHAGDYSLQVSPRAESDFWAMDEIAGQLTDGFWEYNGGSRRSFDAGNNGYVISVDLSQLTVAGQRLADMALSAWEAATGITFVRGAGAGADITFDDNDSGAYASSSVMGQSIISSHVNIGTDWLGVYGTGYDSYSYQTYIHEIGHALGLGHAGNYDGSATYGVDNLYPNDSWQATVMSYFSQADNTRINASEAIVVSAMMADIIAVQDLYGGAPIRTGNNTYGIQTNAGPAYAVIAAMLGDTSRYDDITFTVFDEGGVDRLDLRSDSSDQRINLAPGGISSAYGLIGNISIAEGTEIEELLTGTGNDYVLANSGNNVVRGGSGRDTIYGFSGNDRLFGDQGADHLLGGAGNDAYLADMTDTVTEAINSGTDIVYSYVNYRLGDNLENLSLSVGTALYGGGNALNNFLIGNDAVNVLQGFSGDDTLSGNGGNDTLYGGNGNDQLMGGAGRDLLSGGAGNDIYTTDDLDVISEDVAGPSGGIDTLRATATVALTANVENLVMLGSATQHGFGNPLSNVLIGNSANNVLSGFGGDDRLTGGGGADFFVFRSGSDRIMDFTDDVDTIRIDDVVWGGGARTVAQVLADAEVIGGNTVFDFGNGNTLTVSGLTDIAALQNDLVII